MLVKPLAPYGGEHRVERVVTVEPHRPIGAGDQEPGASEAAREVLEEKQSRCIGPVEVIKDEQKTRVGCRGSGGRRRQDLPGTDPQPPPW